jgi:hypothetical protein
MLMKKYTFLFEFKKGTYVKQVLSADIRNAIIEWFHSLNSEEMSGMTDDIKNTLKIELDQEEPILIDGMDNVWCMFFKINKLSCLLNVVESNV